MTKINKWAKENNFKIKQISPKDKLYSKHTHIIIYQDIKISVVRWNNKTEKEFLPNYEIYSWENLFKDVINFDNQKEIINYLETLNLKG